MRAQTALSLTAFLVVALANGSSVSAQETVTETPPELRDFRLDTPRAQPQAETPPQLKPDPVVVAPPPVVRAQPELRPAVPTRRTQQGGKATQRDSAQVDRLPAKPLTPEPDATPKEMLLPPEAQQVAPAPVILTDADVDKPAPPYWQIAAGLAALGLLTALAFWFRRRRANGYGHAAALPEMEPEPVKDAGSTLGPVTVPQAAVRIDTEANREPTISVKFVPEKATITFATLTIKGQLQINNGSETDAQNMLLRAGLISASHQQQEATSQFFGTAHNITPNPMGKAKAGETIGMDLELSVPLSEMESFTLGEQRMLVPILLASIEYRGDNQTGPHRAEIACMIGRESTPPKAKMGPLRLDLGPRSFAQLGTRPLYA